MPHDSQGDQVPALEVRRVSKRFGNTVALDDVSVRLEAGEVMALFGENGAGKSTLVRILAGSMLPDSGEVFIAGRPVHMRSPKEALEMGVALVAQELAGCPKLTVAENILIGNLPNRWRFTGRTQMLNVAAQLVDRFGLNVPLEDSLDSLKLADRQLVEILKGLARGHRVLLLDEPTASLTSAEATKLLGHLNRLAAEGLSVILVTHRIAEALSFADGILVLRDGRVTHRELSANTNHDEIVRRMLGGEMRRPVTAERATYESQTQSLAIEGWSVAGASPLNNLSVKVGASEVVAIYGLRGSGVEALAAGVAGRMPGIDGTISVGPTGRRVRPFANPNERQRAGVTFVPSDRRQDGLALGLSVRTNTLAPANPKEARRFGVRLFSRERVVTRRMIDELSVVCSGIDQSVGELSGGNQQKILIGSRLLQSGSVLVLHEPTRGVDIGARELIHSQLRRLPSKGIGVLVISSDVDEIVEVADRVVVLRKGEAVASLTGDAIDQAAILLAASGGAG